MIMRKKYLAGGLITKGLRMILKDPASKKALKDLTKLGREAGASRFDINTKKAEGLKKYSKIIENKIRERGLTKPEFTKKGIKFMKDTRSKLTQYLKKNREKVKAMKEGAERTKNFKGGLIRKPKLAKRGF
jgi:hypothetical protein